jgi:hypothetical protein
MAAGNLGMKERFCFEQGISGANGIVTAATNLDAPVFFPGVLITILFF